MRTINDVLPATVEVLPVQPPAGQPESANRDVAGRLGLLAKLIGEGIATVLDAVRRLTVVQISETVSHLAEYRHIVLVTEDASAADAAVKKLLDPFTNTTEQSTTASAIVANGKDGALYRVARSIAPPMSRQLAQLYNDCSRWEAAIKYGREHYRTDSEGSIIEMYMGADVNPKLDDNADGPGAVRRWKEAGTVHIKDSHGEGEYRSPVDAMRGILADGTGSEEHARTFSAVHAAFRNVIRPTVFDLDELPSNAEAEARRRAENNPPQVVVKRKEKDNKGAERLRKKSLPVTDKPATLRGHLQGLALVAKTNGMAPDAFAELCANAIEYARSHDKVNTRQTDDE